MFTLLSDNKESTDVFIQSGTYTLNTSYTLKDLHNIRIGSNASNPAIIMCNISDLDTGVAFLRASDLIIDHLSIVGCGMKHNSTNYLNGKGNLISVYSAMFIQNSTNITLASINICNSTGIGLLMYYTNGTVNITQSIFANNTQEQNLGGGGIHIEFTSCAPGLALYDSHNNHYNKNSKYIINQCTFEGNVATYDKNNYKDGFYNGNFSTFGVGGGISLWFKGQAKNNSFEVVSTIFTSNSAVSGGGLYVHSRENATHNHVKVLWCYFIKNIGSKQGGGSEIGNKIHQTGGLSKFNTYIIINCLFEQNEAIMGVAFWVLAAVNQKI